MAQPEQELVVKIKQEPSWQEYGSNQGGLDGRSPKSPDSQGTENIEMGDIDNESATVEDLGEEWCEDEAGNLCDPLAHMTSDALRSPESSDGGDGGNYGAKRRTLPKRGTHGGPVTRGQKRPIPSRTNPSREVRSRGNMEEVEVLSDTPRTETDSPVLKKKRKAARLALSDQQEEELVEWLQSYPELFDKSHRRYKDIDLKTSLWEEKASELGMESGELLQVWYKSMRTRFGKLRKIISVNKSRQLTWRDQWILKKFHFIAPHIYVCHNRGSVGILKQKLQSRPFDQQHSGSEDEETYEDLYKLASIPDSIAAPSPSVTLPTPAASSTSQLPAQMDSFQTFPLVNQVSQPSGQVEQLLAGISAAVLAGQNDGMAKGYGNFLSNAVTSLHPSLLTSFYQESWALVMKYHMQSEELKEKERQGSVIPLSVRPVVNHLPQMSQNNAESTVQSSSKAQSEVTQQSPRSRQRLQQP